MTLILRRRSHGNRAPRPPLALRRSSPQARGLVAAYPLITPGRIAISRRQATPAAELIITNLNR